MRKHLLYLGLLLSIVVGGSFVEVFTGCSTVNRAAYVGTVGARVSVEAGMGLFNELIKAGKVSPTQEQVVKNAYLKLQRIGIALCDAGKVASAASQASGTAAVSDALNQLTADYQQALGDLRAALAQFNINI